ncbi:MAG: phasin family protein [candidate division Zixibacteria bacterium]|nr:phasin family protein [candidate division Zixibacteria bacterium]
MADIFEKALLAGLGLFDLTREKAEKLANELIKRGELSQSDKAKAVKEILKGHEERARKIKEKIDQHVNKAVEKLKGVTAQELSELNKKIEKLSKELEKLGEKLEKK